MKTRKVKHWIIKNIQFAGTATINKMKPGQRYPVITFRGYNSNALIIRIAIRGMDVAENVEFVQGC